MRIVISQIKILIFSEQKYTSGANSLLISLLRKRRMLVQRRKTEEIQSIIRREVEGVRERERREKRKRGREIKSEVERVRMI